MTGGTPGGGPPADFAAVVRELSLDAWRTNHARADELGNIAAAVREQGTLTPDQRERATSLAHHLRGSAGTFGHAAVAVSAERIERLLRGMPTTPGRDLHRLDRLIDDVHEALERDPTPDV